MPDIATAENSSAANTFWTCRCATSYPAVAWRSPTITTPRSKRRARTVVASGAGRTGWAVPEGSDQSGARSRERTSSVKLVPGSGASRGIIDGLTRRLSGRSS